MSLSYKSVISIGYLTLFIFTVHIQLYQKHTTFISIPLYWDSKKYLFELLQIRKA